MGLQYGQTTAVQDEFIALKSDFGIDPDIELPPTWRGLLFPAKSGWFDLISEIDGFCAKEPTKTVPQAAALTLSGYQGDYRDAGKPDARFKFLMEHSCKRVTRVFGPWFFSGYQDGQHYYWDQVQATMDKSTSKPMAELRSRFEEIESKTPAGIDLFSSVANFCSESKNSDVMFTFASRSVALRQKGRIEEADSLLSPYRCRNQPSIWIKGREGKATTCSGVTVIVNASPVLVKPLSFIAGVLNDTGQIVELDWSNWTLEWVDHKGNVHSSRALDPSKIEHRLERQANITAALTAFGSYLSSSATETIVVNGPEGRSTIQVYPSAETAANISREHAEEAAEPKLSLARTLRDASFRRTTVLPHSRSEGMLLFFDSPPVGDAVLKVDIPGTAVAKFSVVLHSD